MMQPASATRLCLTGRIRRRRVPTRTLAALRTVFAERAPDRVGETLRVADETPFAFAHVAVAVHTLPTPYAHRVVKEAPVEIHAFGWPRGQELTHCSSDTIARIAWTIEEIAQRFRARVHVRRDYVRL